MNELIAPSTSAFDNRSDELSQIEQEVVATDNIGATIATKMTYSQSIQNRPKFLSKQNEVFPKKEQAIIIPSLNDISTEDYLKAVSEYITPQNIIYAQKISNNRMCIFLRSKEVVENLLQKTDSVKIRNQKIPIRKLVTPAKRIIISGGSPIIPHIEIEKLMIDNNFKLVSGVTFMRTGIRSPEFQHVQTFNRQFYTNLPDNAQFPETLTIKYEEETYRLFLTVSGTCYKCKQEGHIVKDCPLNTQRPQPIMPEPANENLILQTEPLQQQIPIQTETLQQPILRIDIDSAAGIKRSLNDETSSQSSSPVEELNVPNIPIIRPEQKRKNTNKKVKASKPIETLMQPIEKPMNESPTEYCLNYEQLKAFIFGTKGNSNISSLAQKYVLNPNLLIDTLSKLYPQLEHRSIKARFTKIINILANPQESNPVISSDDDEQTQ